MVQHRGKAGGTQHGSIRVPRSLDVGRRQQGSRRPITLGAIALVKVVDRRPSFDGLVDELAESLRMAQVEVRGRATSMMLARRRRRSSTARRATTGTGAGATRGRMALAVLVCSAALAGGVRAWHRPTAFHEHPPAATAGGSVAAAIVMPVSAPESSPGPLVDNAALSQPNGPEGAALSRAANLRTASLTEAQPIRRLAGALTLRAVLSGPAGERELTMMVDTGATYSMLTEAAARQLGLVVGAVGVEVATVNGRIRQPAVVIDAVGAAGVEVSGGLTAVVCSRCAWEGIDGILGRNFLRHFRVSLDEEAGSITFANTGRTGASRLFDVEPFVRLSSGHARREGDRLHLELIAENRAPRSLTDVELSVRLPATCAFANTGDLRVKIGNLAPGEQHHTTVEAQTVGTVACDGPVAVQLVGGSW